MHYEIDELDELMIIDKFGTTRYSLVQNEKELDKTKDNLEVRFAQQREFTNHPKIKPHYIKMNLQEHNILTKTMKKSFDKEKFIIKGDYTFTVDEALEDINYYRKCMYCTDEIPKGVPVFRLQCKYGSRNYIEIHKECFEEFLSIVEYNLNNFKEIIVSEGIID